MFRIQFPTKTSVDAYVYFLPELSCGVPKTVMFEILEWESRFTLGLNVVKNTDCIIKIVQNSISYKKHRGAYVYLTQEWSYKTLKIVMFQILEWESRFTLGLNAAKNTNYTG